MNIFGLDELLRGIFQRNWDAVGLIDVIEILLNVIKLLLILGGAFATTYIIFSGYLYLTAYGNEQAITKGKSGLTGAIIGLAIIILSFSIVQMVMGAIVPADKIPEDIKYFNNK